VPEATIYLLGSYVHLSTVIAFLCPFINLYASACGMTVSI
jgi:hypothetical protein